MCNVVHTLYYKWIKLFSFIHFFLLHLQWVSRQAISLRLKIDFQDWVGRLFMRIDAFIIYLCLSALLRQRMICLNHCWNSTWFELNIATTDGFRRTRMRNAFLLWVSLCCMLMLNEIFAYSLWRRCLFLANTYATPDSIWTRCSPTYLWRLACQILSRSTSYIKRHCCSVKTNCKYKFLYSLISRTNLNDSMNIKNQSHSNR